MRSTTQQKDGDDFMIFSMMEAEGEVHGFRVFTEFEDGDDKRSQKRLFECRDFENMDEGVAMKSKRASMQSKRSFKQFHDIVES